MSGWRRSRISPFVLLLTTTFAGCGSDNEETLFVFAAASLRDLALDLGREFKEQTGRDIRYNFAASNALARQWEATGQGDVFLSAHPRWIEFLQNKNVMNTESHVFLSNKIVMIAHQDAPWSHVTLDDITGLDARFSLAHPDAVPAGIYARQALTKTGAWDHVKTRAVLEVDVRAALGRAESDSQVISFVYHTDALTSSEIKVLGDVPSELMDPIVYTAGVRSKKGHPSLATQFVQFLLSDKAQGQMAQLGFARPETLR